MKLPIRFARASVGSRSRPGWASFVLASAAVSLVPLQISPRSLKVSRSVAVTWPGPARSWVLGPVQCDAKADLFLRPMSPVGGRIDEGAAVVSITASGAAGAKFDPSGIPTHRKQVAVVGNFAVGPAGSVYFISRVCPSAGGSCHEEVAKFRADGRYEASTTLEGPDFNPEGIAVFGNGGFLATGFASDAENPLTPYATVYGPRGKLITEVKLPGDSKPPAMPTGPVGSGTGVSLLATDGRGSVYLVRPVFHAVLFRISQRGVVLGSFPLVPPFPDGVPVAIQSAGSNRVLIQFGERTAQGVAASGYFYSLVDGSDGRTVSRYTADRAAGGLLGCYLPSAGVEFLSRHSDGKAEIRFDRAQ